MSSLIVEVCKIDDIYKHPNADRLSIAVVKGWNVIVGLEQYKKGDLIVFIPPDSIIPQNIIDKYNLTYLKNGGRVGTTKLRGYISQGLILDVPEGNYKIGDDVSKVLGITKWKPPTKPIFKGNQPTKKKINPLFDKYTDIENIKNYNNVFTEDDEVVVSEKIHGTNFRAANLPIYMKHTNIILKIFNIIKFKLFGGYEFCYGSRNIQLTFNNKKNQYYKENVYKKIVRKYNLKKLIPKDYIIYGEIYGEKIQDLEYGLEDIELVIFDIKYKGRYLPYDEFMNFCKKYKLPIVPILYTGKYNKEMIDKYTNGKSTLSPIQIREGCVIKDRYELNHPRIGRKILKSISVDYLLRKNATEYH